MKVEREKLLKTLDVAVVGTTPREILEQSNCFVFTEDSLVTFNGEIFTKAKNPVPEVVGAVPAEDFRALLAKFPDDVVDVRVKRGEVRVRGKKKEAGLTVLEGVRLPYGGVPGPGEWVEPPPELLPTLLQASRVCGKDDSQPRTMDVHVTSGLVEACDNYRLFRSTMETGVPRELLLPAASISAVGTLAFSRLSTHGGWLHLQRKGGHRVSLRCSSGDYPNVSTLLELGDARKVRLPGNLSDILSRASVMQDSTDALVSIKITRGELVLRSRKDTGWYQESREIKYDGEPFSFDVNPEFLEEVLAKTRTVKVSKSRMKIEAGEVVFVVALDKPGEKESEEE